MHGCHQEQFETFFFHTVRSVGNIEVTHDQQASNKTVTYSKFLKFSNDRHLISVVVSFILHTMKIS